MRYQVVSTTRRRWAVVDTVTGQLLLLVSDTNRNLCDSMAKRLNDEHQ